MEMLGDDPLSIIFSLLCLESKRNLCLVNKYLNSVGKSSLLEPKWDVIIPNEKDHSIPSSQYYCHRWDRYGASAKKEIVKDGFTPMSIVKLYDQIYIILIECDGFELVRVHLLVGSPPEDKHIVSNRYEALQVMKKIIPRRKVNHFHMYGRMNDGRIVFLYDNHAKGQDKNQFYVFNVKEFMIKFI